MKKIRKLMVCIALIQVLFCFLYGCGPGPGDYSIPLCNNYSINRPNASQVQLCQQRENHNYVVLPSCYVCEYAVIEEYIFLAVIETPDGSLTDRDTSDYPIVYYIVDSKTDEIIGPFIDEDKLNKKVQIMGIAPMIDWKKTD